MCVKVTVCAPCGSLRLYFTEYLFTDLLFELDVSMKFGVLVPPMNTQSDSVGCLLVLGNTSLRCAFVALRNDLVFVIQPKNISE